ncbi:hypothetical protein BGZ99_002095 [Dissophora globulifera]|uniref:Uncharacterized protein n=1 Tax=Dissophora globulifera TaxID=979702 RepID=A0A9P6UJC3_9FUNG|nr:hypothetical protein BGZ99_002095 [Dissophora globulifera]
MFANTKKFIAPLAAVLVACMAVEATFIQSCACHGVSSGNDAAATKTICDAAAAIGFDGVHQVPYIHGQTYPASFDGTSCSVTIAGQVEFIKEFCELNQHGTTVCKAL